MMLNNQPFRDLYLVDNLPNELSLRVKDITLMFTDLKGSTEMYQFAGDARAYGLVKEHFSILQRMVQENEGAIVKTMGDAIMASFSSPSDAVHAAIRMLEKIAEFNQSADPGLIIGLKLGIHRGPVIAVKANQTLDYFGQTVNIAARVQALSESGEIHTTEDVLREDEVRVLFAKAGFSPEARSETLKGVKNPVSVVRFRKAEGSLEHPS